MNGTLETTTAQPQQPERDDDRPFLTLEQGARRACCDLTAQNPVTAFRKWIGKVGMPVCRRGRVLLVERRVLDAYLRQEDWTVRRQGARHRQQSTRGVR